mmetsp:Transcript_10185/g.12360  ORF Transcript_10185/g.12360 Transcript_10185/m.12360 type:complete len:294 (+) Transcript_10185:19-900(+)
MATKLRALGFCGVDDTVSPELLASISARYEFVEWGILLRDELEGTPRYASKPWMERLKVVNANKSMRLAGHLCSKRCEQILKGDASYVQTLHEQFGINRFQVNATVANNVNNNLVNDEGAMNLLNAILSLPNIEFILQRNEETRPIWEFIEKQSNSEKPQNMSYLFDESKGTGVVAAEWPDPPNNVKFGYAGGLGPKTLETQMEKMLLKTNSFQAKKNNLNEEDDHSSNKKMKLNDNQSAASSLPVEIWVDMESSLRTLLKDDTDIFDVNKAMECVFISLAFASDGRMASPGL